MSNPINFCVVILRREVYHGVRSAYELDVSWAYERLLTKKGIQEMKLPQIKTINVSIMFIIVKMLYVFYNFIVRVPQCHFPVPFEVSVEFLRRVVSLHRYGLVCHF